MKEGPIPGRISSESVREATGRDWEEWLGALDAAGAADWEHKAIVGYLEREHPEVASGRWRQSLTVAYEQARGKRAVGETAGAGFQVGVQRRVAASTAEAWRLMVSPRAVAGRGGIRRLRRGRAVRGGAGERRSRRERRDPRREARRASAHDWQPQGWAAPATVQLTLSESGSGKTAVHAHLEKLPDADAREAMRTRWREAPERIAAAIR